MKLLRMVTLMEPLINSVVSVVEGCPSKIVGAKSLILYENKIYTFYFLRSDNSLMSYSEFPKINLSP